MNSFLGFVHFYDKEKSLEINWKFSDCDNPAKLIIGEIEWCVCQSSSLISMRLAAKIEKEALYTPSCSPTRQYVSHYILLTGVSGTSGFIHTYVCNVNKRVRNVSGAQKYP